MTPSPHPQPRSVARLFMSFELDCDSLAHACERAVEFAQRLPEDMTPYVSISSDERRPPDAPEAIDPMVPKLLTRYQLAPQEATMGNVMAIAADALPPAAIAADALPPAAPAASTTEAPAVPSDAPSVDELRAACKARIDADAKNRAAINALLKQYGAESISSVAPEQRAAFIAAVGVIV